jgi:outer membrane protein insertion porin family
MGLRLSFLLILKGKNLEQQMKKLRNQIIFALFLILTLLVPAALFSRDSYEGKMVVKINFEGLIQSDLLSVKSVINTKVRSELSYKTINDDIIALNNLELFDDIKVDVVENADGLVITYIFVELPTIRDIVFRGNVRVRDIALKDRVLLKKDMVFKEQEIPDELREIIALYEEKGFPNTTVTYEIKRAEIKDKKTKKRKEVIDLIFIIQESGKVIIKSVNFSGISSPPEEQKIKRLIKTRRRGYIFSAGYMKEDQFELDKREIIRYYGSKGYIDAQIVKVDRSVTWNERWKREEIDLTLYIEEGDQYIYRGVKISGNKIFTDDELYSLIDLKEDTIFDATKWEVSVQNIRNLLAENGYIYYTMSVKQDKDSENLNISFRITMSENNKAHVEHIFITGNEKTKRFVIAREIVIQEGEIFNAKKIQISREKLFNLQYFASVNIDVKPGSELGLVDLIFDVEEQRTGLFTFGLSYSTAGYGISLFEEVSANNFLGRGLRLHEKVDIGYTWQAVEVGIDEPWLFNTPTLVGLTLSYGRTEYGSREGDIVYTWNEGKTDPDTGDKVPDGAYIDNPPLNPGPGPLGPEDEIDYTLVDKTQMKYTNNTFKVAFRLGRRFAHDWGISSELAFSVFQNNPFDKYKNDVPFDDSLEDQYYDNWPLLWKNYLSLTGYRDTRDNTIFATKGYYIGQNVTIFGGPLGGYSNFFRLGSEMNVNVKTFWKLILSARLNIGYILPLPGKELVIDDIDYLRIDGMNEGRGWQRPSQFTSLYAERGEAELNFSLEYRFPISERFVWGLAFFDVSDLYDNPKIKIDYRDLYYSTGLGIGFLIPGFPIRLYLARRFKYDYKYGKIRLANSQVFMESWDFIFAVAGFF